MYNLPYQVTKLIKIKYKIIYYQNFKKVPVKQRFYFKNDGIFLYILPKEAVPVPDCCQRYSLALSRCKPAHYSIIFLVFYDIYSIRRQAVL